MVAVGRHRDLPLGHRDDTFAADDPTGPTYTPTAADVGKVVRVVATGTTDRFGGGTATATSYPTAPITAAPVVPPVVAPVVPPVVAPVVPPVVAPLPSMVNEREPRITGTLRVGKVVRVAAGQWTPTPQTLAYTWYADGKVVKGANGKSLRLTKKQAGKRLRVVVTASAPTHQPFAVRTKRTEKVKP